MLPAKTGSFGRASRVAEPALPAITGGVPAGGIAIVVINLSLRIAPWVTFVAARRARRAAGATTIIVPIVHETTATVPVIITMIVTETADEPALAIAVPIVVAATATARP